ncbi:MAG: calcium/sodium antiporter [Actinobacteria bacterium]|nr:calcium/sodium antiporter [Actinomycetota bacterium]
MNPALLLAVLVGLALLAWSADHLVLGASRVAARLGVPTLVVGVVVIGFGTSTPEMLVSGLAAGGGAADVGVGNVIGSNLANLTLVLGVAALVASIGVRSTVVRREVPLSLAASGLFALLLQNGLTRRDGVLLALAMAASLALLLRWTARDRRAADDTNLVPSVLEPAGPDPELAEEVLEMLADPDDATGSGGPAAPPQQVRLRREVWRTLGGLVGTLAGAELLVRGALGIASATGLSGGFVGVTIVAVGTSLPELLTAAQAARRGESDLVVGNLLGSNIFNALTVGALVALLAPGRPGGDALVVTGSLVMMGAGVLSMLFMWRRYRVTRVEGAVLVAAYVAVLPALNG